MCHKLCHADSIVGGRMTQKSVPGTKVRGGAYFLNLRIPKEAAHAYPGKTHLRDSLKTADPKVAAQKVTLTKAELIRAASAANAKATADAALAAAVAALTPEQHYIYTAAGGLAGLLDRYTQSTHWLERAREPLPPSDPPQPAPTTAYERWVEEEAEAEFARHLAREEQVLKATAKTLQALGQPVDVPGGYGLRELAKANIAAKGTGGQTADAVLTICQRFVELHGDLPIADLTIAHLREYAEAAKGLPAVPAGKEYKGLAMPALLERVRVSGAATISEATRAKHIAMLKALTAFAPGQGYLTSDPWAAFKLLKVKAKHSAPPPRAPFTGEQIGRILEWAKGFDAATIDRWAPILAAYQGMRREEIGQLRGADVLEVDGVFCVRVTDEGAGQKVKNAASFRTIPLHRAVLDAGFADFAKARPADSYLFKEQPRWGDLQEVASDTRGRLSEPYGKRFGKALRAKLSIPDTRLTFHSFRHSWEDAAEAVDMPQTHRRELAGRTKAGDSQAHYGAGPKLSAMKVSLDKLDPLTL